MPVNKDFVSLDINENWGKMKYVFGLSVAGTTLAFQNYKWDKNVPKEQKTLRKFWVPRAGSVLLASLGLTTVLGGLILPIASNYFFHVIRCI